MYFKMLTYSQLLHIILHSDRKWKEGEDETKQNV